MLWMLFSNVSSVNQFMSLIAYTSLLCYPILHSSLPVKDFNNKKKECTKNWFYYMYYSIHAVPVPQSDYIFEKFSKFVAHRQIIIVTDLCEVV